MILAHADIGVVPSLHETFSLALVEIMATGKPAVTAPVGIAPEIVTDDNHVGYMVPQRDPEAIAQAIIKLLANSETAKEMGMRGRKLVEENFTMDVMAMSLKKVYEAGRALIVGK